MTNKFTFEPDMAAKTILMSREFNAPVEKVWKAHTDPDLIAKWMGPKPFTALIKKWDFTVGGIWLYTLVGPNGPGAWWTRMEFTAIDPGNSFSATGSFSDEEGNDSAPDAPRTYRDVSFISLEGNRSRLDTVIKFTHDETIKMFAEGGFKEGMIACFDQLDELMAAE